MHVHCRNVNDAFTTLVRWASDPDFYTSTKYGRSFTRTTSRNGNVLVFNEPVTVTYSHPRERVLFNAVRDANPFFHVFEAMWMLAGRDDVAPLAWFVKQMAEFSDNGTTLNGAYGYRWRHAKTDDPPHDYYQVDQLEVIARHLRANPDSRRAVLSMWNVEDDLLKMGGRCTRHPPGLSYMPCKHCGGTGKEPGGSKDICCNLNVMFALRELTEVDRMLQATHVKTEDSVATMRRAQRYALDMTVTNRSNDLLWGMLGANYVHFSVLQEYMAAKVNAQVGVYHHVTNNLHVYVDRHDWQPEALLTDPLPDLYVDANLSNHKSAAYSWGRDFSDIVPVVDNQVRYSDRWADAVFDAECADLCNDVCELVNGTEPHDEPGSSPQVTFSQKFLERVVKPMMIAHYWHKAKQPARAVRWADSVGDPGWRFAALEWLHRRYRKQEGKV